MKKIFVASSSSENALNKAQIIKHILESIEGVSVNCWFRFSGFRPGDYTLENLERAVQEHSGGVFVFDRDDRLAEATTDGCLYLPRDNVLIELGLFCGKLGRKPILICLVPDVHVPSDLSGITRVSYDVENEGRMRAEFQRWLINVPEFYNLPPNNLYMDSRKEIHSQYTLDDRLHLSDGMYKYIKNIRFMNFACNLFVNPEVADIGELKGEVSPLAVALNKIMKDTEASLNLILTEPTECNLFDAETKIANWRAGGPKEAIRSAVKAVYDMLTAQASMYRTLYNKRFMFYLSKISLPFGIFNVTRITAKAQ